MYMICKHDMWIKSLRYRKFSYVAMLMIVFPLLFIFSMSTSPFLTDLVTSVVKASFACFVFLKSYSLTWNPRPIRNVDFQAQFLGNVLMEVIHCLQMGTQFRKAYSWLSPRILSRGPMNPSDQQNGGKPFKMEVQIPSFDGLLQQHVIGHPSEILWARLFDWPQLGFERPPRKIGSSGLDGYCLTWGFQVRGIRPERIPGWWLTYPSEKYEFVSWDDIPNIWENI